MAEDSDKKIARWLPLATIISLSIWAVSIRVLRPPHAPVGTYIALLALLAGVMTIWPPENQWLRFTWAVIFAALLYLEVSTLYQQKHDDDAQRKQDRVDEDNRFAGLNRQEDDRFAGILKTQQEEFSATLGRIEGVGRLASESLEEQTGGKSFCFFLGSFGTPNPNPTRFTLMLYVIGKHTMHGVSAQIQTVHPPNEAIQQLLSMHEIPLGDGNILPGAHQTREIITPGHYFMTIFARNGLLSEELEIKLKDGNPRTSMTVTRGREVLYKIVDEKVTVHYKVR